MKRTIALILVAVFLVVLTACAKTSDYTLEYGESDMYTKQDIESAAKAVLDEFNTFDGCVLYSLTYAGDEKCMDELSYVNSLKDDEGEEFVDCLVFDSEFRSPIRGGGAWTANSIYTWSWYLGREKDSEWVLVTFGYA